MTSLTSEAQFLEAWRLLTSGGFRVENPPPTPTLIPAPMHQADGRRTPFQTNIISDPLAHSFPFTQSTIYGGLSSTPTMAGIIGGTVSEGSSRSQLVHPTILSRPAPIAPYPGLSACQGPSSSTSGGLRGLDQSNYPTVNASDQRVSSAQRNRAPVSHGGRRHQGIPRPGPRSSTRGTPGLGDTFQVISLPEPTSLELKVDIYARFDELMYTMDPLVGGQVAGKAYMVLETMALHRDYRLMTLGRSVTFPTISVNTSLRNLLDVVQERLSEGSLKPSFPDFGLQPDGTKTPMFDCLTIKSSGRGSIVKGLPRRSKMEISHAPLSSTLREMFLSKTKFSYPLSFSQQTPNSSCFTLRLVSVTQDMLTHIPGLDGSDHRCGGYRLLHNICADDIDRCAAAGGTDTFMDADICKLPWIMCGDESGVAVPLNPLEPSPSSTTSHSQESSVILTSQSGPSPAPSTSALPFLGSAIVDLVANNDDGDHRDLVHPDDILRMLTSNEPPIQRLRSDSQSSILIPSLPTSWASSMPESAAAPWGPGDPISASAASLVALDSSLDDSGSSLLPQSNSPADLLEHVLDCANRAQYPRRQFSDSGVVRFFRLHAPSIEGLGVALEMALERCFDAGSAREILRGDWSFMLSNTAGTHGEGVVREVITKRADFRWNGWNSTNVSVTVGGRLVFSSSSPSNTVLPSTAQRRSAFVLGGLTMLSILFCHRLPSNVFELNWLLHINDGAPGCLTRAALKEFAPDLLDALDDFDRGDDSHILPIVESYCYTGTVSAGPILRALDQEQRAMYRSHIVQQCIGGNISTVDETQAFRDGLNLKCSNGFRMSDLVARYAGGALGVLQDINGSRIRSFADIEGIIDFVEPARATEHLLAIPGHSYSSLADVIKEFLRGTGIPTGFDAETYGLDLDALGGGGATSPAFRSNAFLRAATGSDHLQRGMIIQVVFEETAIGSTQSTGAADDVIAWHTCYGQVRFNAAEIRRILGSGECAEDRLTFWLFSSIITAVSSDMGGLV